MRLIHCSIVETESGKVLEGSTLASACFKINFKGFEVSIACDNNCGINSDCSRTDIRVYREQDDKDITSEVYHMLYGEGEEQVLWSDEELFRVLTCLDVSFRHYK